MSDGVVCLHSSASSSRQWRALSGRLAGEFRVETPDLYGSGAAPPWPGGRPLTLADEVARLEPAIRTVGEPFHLVGHSYGGAVALHLALADPGRIRSLVLFEPVLFGLLVAEDPEQPGAREILDVSRRTATGELAAAGETFIDYWMGAGAWAASPEPRRQAFAQAMSGVREQWPALFDEPTPLAAYGKVGVPTLLLTGTDSPASSRGVARLLAETLPDVTVVMLEEVGHMGPVTHPALVNELIAGHLNRLA